MKKLVYKFIIAALSASVLSACMGYGDNNNAKKDTDPGPIYIVGKAIKGPIVRGKVICFDANGKELASTFTDNDGNFKLDTFCPKSGRLVLRGGFDSSATPAAAVDELIASGDSKYITPVTTMDYITKKYNIAQTDSGSEELIQGSSNNDPSDKTSEKSKRLLKMGVVLHYMVKNIQQQSAENLSYEDGMRVVAEKLKTKKVQHIADDTKLSEAKKIVGDVFSELETAGVVKIPKANKDKIDDIINEKATNLQYKDLQKGGLNDFVPSELREPLSPYYVKVAYEYTIANLYYQLRFERDNRFEDVPGLTYECGLVEKKDGVAFTYRKDWNKSSTVKLRGCLLNRWITFRALQSANKFLVIKYIDKKTNRFGYSVPHKLGSKVGLVNAREMTFNDKVYLPIAGSINSYVEKDISTDLKNGLAVTDLKTSGRKMGYLPVGFYYKPIKVPTIKLNNARFGVKLGIGSKDLIMMADNLYIKDNAMKSSSSDNPYLHSIGDTNSWSWRKSVYYHNANSLYFNSTVLSDLNRSDYHSKSGFLRFKAPSAVDDVLKLSSQTKLSGDLVGVSLADMCNIPIQKYKHSKETLQASVCDYIRATINAENAKSVTITPFIEASSKVARSRNRVSTNKGKIDIKGKSYASFPAITVKGKPDDVNRIEGKKGLKGVDSDKDGVSDYDEMLLGRKPFDASDKFADTDGDGIIDLKELKLGMNPNNINDKIVFRVNPLSVAIAKASKAVTVTLVGGGKSRKYINISLAGGAENVVSISEPLNRDIEVDIGEKIIHIIPNEFIDTSNVTLPQIVIKGKLKNASESYSLTTQTITLTSDDFVHKLRPRAVRLSYKTSVGGSSINNLTPESFLEGVELQAIVTPSVKKPAGATTQYRWEISSDGINWTAISGENGSKYVVKVADIGKIIRISAVHKKPDEAVNWGFSVRKIASNILGDMVQVHPNPPTVKPTLSSNNTPNSKYYRGSLVTMTTTEKDGYEVVYVWKKGTIKINSATAKTYKIPVNEALNVKISGCYAYKKGRVKSAYLCSDQISLEQPLVGKPVESKLPTTRSTWGTDIKFTPVNGQEYKLVKTDGSANDDSTGISLVVSAGVGKISATKAGVIKLQTRKPATATTIPSAWTSGKTITFTKQTQTIKVGKKKLAMTIFLGRNSKRIKAKTSGDGEISYTKKSSSAGNVTVDSKTGAIHRKSVANAGTVIITVTASATDKYEQATKDVKVIYEFIKTPGKIWSNYMGEINWINANSICSKLNSFGRNGWRLPTRTELKALANKYPKEKISEIGYPANGGDTIDHDGVYWTSEDSTTHKGSKYVVIMYSGKESSIVPVLYKRYACVTTP